MSEFEELPDGLKAALRAAFVEGYIQGAHHPPEKRIIQHADDLSELWIETVRSAPSVRYMVEDKLRLDWLESEQPWLSHWGRREMDESRWRVEHIDWHHGRTLREAIDTAIADIKRRAGVDPGEPS